MAVHAIALQFAYDGSKFPNGYARQPEGATVEDALLKALAREGFVADSWKTGSRTDKGVSAIENVGACQVERGHLGGLVPALQTHLPDGVWVTGVANVSPEWQPRHHGLRTYSYLMPKQGESLDPMVRAAARFEGEHNLAAFAKVEDHRDPIRKIVTCNIVDDGAAWRITVESPGFLWNQVRRMVDALMRVGRGKTTVQEIEDALQTGDAPPKCKLAPAEGLLLESVRYEPELVWLAEAGETPPGTVRPAWQANQVQSRLLEAVSKRAMP